MLRNTIECDKIVSLTTVQSNYNNPNGPVVMVLNFMTILKF